MILLCRDHGDLENSQSGNLTLLHNPPLSGFPWPWCNAFLSPTLFSLDSSLSLTLSLLLSLSILPLLTCLSHIYVSPSHAPPRSSLNSFPLPLCLTSVCLQRSFLLSISPTRPFLSTFHPVLSSLRRGSEEGGASLSAVRVPRLIWP